MLADVGEVIVTSFQAVQRQALVVVADRRLVVVLIVERGSATATSVSHSSTVIAATTPRRRLVPLGVVSLLLWLVGGDESFQLLGLSFVQRVPPAPTGEIRRTGAAELRRGVVHFFGGGSDAARCGTGGFGGGGLVSAP
jgi:hypothetical protein